MKRIAISAAIFLLLAACVPAAQAAPRTPADVASVLRQLDAHDGIAGLGWPGDMTRMMHRAATQCMSDGKRSSATHIGDMIEQAHNLLKEKKIFVSRYNLLDVVDSVLADGRDHSCSRVLAMYVTLRNDPIPKKHLSHIGAYKTIQTFRDTGIL